MIIIEGPDGSGKSTLARSIAEKTNLPFSHSGGPAKDEAEARYRYLDLIFRLDTMSREIIDRVIIISERIYGPIFDRPTFFTWDDVLTFVACLHHPVIYCRPSDEQLMASIEEQQVKAHKSLEYIEQVKRNQQLVIATYDQMMGYIPHIRYDWTGKCATPWTPEAIIEKITRWQ